MRSDKTLRTTIVLACLLGAPSPGLAQGNDARAMNMAEHAMGGDMDSIMMKHMILSPARVPTREDSAKALAVVKELRAAIAKYQDTTAAVADGFSMFAPNIKNQHVYHFTKLGNALMEMFQFEPDRPTSLLYERDAAGKLKLVGAMYTMPRRTPLARLDERIPLGIAHWHRHVNWCMPANNRQDRWNETKDGMPVFGPESPIATRAECDKVGGQFTPALFGWMVHANVFKGDDLETIFSDKH